MFQDLHSHTYHSFCGRDNPQALIETAINANLDIFGITDHNYGVGLQNNSIVYNDANVYISHYNQNIRRYFDYLTALRDLYKDKITLLRGIEICTVDRGDTLLPEGVDISMFDYCIIEHLDVEGTTLKDLFAFAKRCGCRFKGVAHTDIPTFLRKNNIDLLSYFSKMANDNIFWEMNVNYDSIHGFNEHQYVKNFFEDKELIEIIRKSGVRLGVGFDGHNLAEYKPDRVKNACLQIEELGIPLVFS